MRGGSSQPQQPDTTAPADGLIFKVADVTCAYCAETITKAIPAAKVHADPVSKLVTVAGVTNLAAVQALVVKVGFTPSAA